MFAEEVTTGMMLQVRPDIDPEECPVGHVTGGRVGLVEDIQTDEDGDTAALLWFGEVIPRLHSDGCWIYVEWLVPAPVTHQEGGLA